MRLMILWRRLLVKSASCGPVLRRGHGFRQRWRGTCFACHRRLSSSESSHSTQGPMAAYKQCVDLGDLRHDAVQVGVITELERLHRELQEYKPPERPVIENSSATKGTRGWWQTIVERTGLALGGDSDRPSGASGPVVSRFGAPKHLQKEASSRTWLSQFNSSGGGSSRQKGIAIKEDVYAAPKGVYVWGGVGSGKTRLMDMFFDTVQSVPKQRVHFHSFMLSVHRSLYDARRKFDGDGAVAMKLVANRVLDEGVLLCLDEFQVVDIADALVVKTLFEAIFDLGGVLVATSNRSPDMLYHNGIQRQLFEPFIPMLKSRCAIASVSQSTTDYRVEIGSGETARVYFVSGDADGWEDCKQRLAKKPSFEDIAELRVRDTGRAVAVPRCDLAVRACLFEFDELCGAALGAADYLAIAAAFRIVFLDAVPILDLGDLNRTRRFITLVDTFYENYVILVVRAAAQPARLFVKDKSKLSGERDLLGDGTLDIDAKSDRDEAFAFDRTTSRLAEMGSSDYIRRSATRRPPLAIDILRFPGDRLDVDHLFQLLDVDNSGFLNVTELAALLADVSEIKRGHRHVPDAELQFALKNLDTDGDGKISSAEFRNYLMAQSECNFDASIFSPQSPPV